MVTIPTREQAEALRAELDTYVAREEFPGDLTIAPTNIETIVVSSLRAAHLCFIDRNGQVRR